MAQNSNRKGSASSSSAVRLSRNAVCTLGGSEAIQLAADRSACGSEVELCPGCTAAALVALLSAKSRLHFNRYADPLRDLFEPRRLDMSRDRTALPQALPVGGKILSQGFEFPNKRGHGFPDLRAPLLGGHLVHAAARPLPLERPHGAPRHQPGAAQGAP